MRACKEAVSAPSVCAEGHILEQGSFNNKYMYLPVAQRPGVTLSSADQHLERRTWRALPPRRGECRGLELSGEELSGVEQSATVTAVNTSTHRWHL